MRQILVVLFLFFTLIQSSTAEVLKGTVSESTIPEGFFGTWHVTSKIYQTNNAKMFNPLSVDIWTLSGFGNTLILENMHSGAKSSIQVQPVRQGLDGKRLKFTRMKTTIAGNTKTVQKESPEFVLNGNIFTGYDTFIIEKYENNKLLGKDVVKYKVVGQKISGESKIK